LREAAAIWTEAMLLQLEPVEYDFQEFKRSLFLADVDRIKPDFTTLLSKQLSAFANGAGGHLFLGIDDNGKIDGGLLVDLKAGGTRSWLEDIIPALLDPPLKKFNIHEVCARRGTKSQIKEGHAVYVIEIPASSDAPHQSLDYRYYLRIAGKSRPMGSVHLQDVLQRVRHPSIEMSRVGPFGRPEYREDDPRGPKVGICFQTFLNNLGRNRARHVGAELILPRPLLDAFARQRILEGPEVSLSQRPGEVSIFRFHPYPLFPDQSIFFLRVWISIHTHNMNSIRNGAALLWRIYADDAPPRQGQTPFLRFNVVRKALKWLERKSR